MKTKIIIASSILFMLLIPVATLQAKHMSYKVVSSNAKQHLGRYTYTSQEKELKNIYKPEFD